MMRRKLVVAATVVAAIMGFSAGLANAGGANSGGPYANDCQSSSSCLASQNGNGNGNHVGRPDAGSVGKADGKNPPGQEKKLNGDPLSYPADDGDFGYECDSNFGVGKGNPAHSPCEVNEGPT